MKKKLLISAVSAIVLLAAGLVIRTQSESLQFLNRNVAALSNYEGGPHLMSIIECQQVWSHNSPDPIFFLSCGDWDPFMKPDKIYSCELAVGIPISSGSCVLDW